MTPITMYSTTWCGYCRRLKRQLDDDGIAYREVDVDREKGFDEMIVEASGGFRTVPTIAIGDRLLVNPTLREIKDALGPAAN